MLVNEEGYYFNKVKEKLTDMVENHGLSYMNFYCGEDVYNMTLEERCRFWLVFMDTIENMDNLTFKEDFPETLHNIIMNDYIDLINNQYIMLLNPHMDV